MGSDPEYGKKHYIVDMKWLSLDEIPERDRCFVWAAGLIGVEGMAEEISAWNDEISYPKTQ